MSSINLDQPAVPQVIAVKRNDPVYGAHAYLTKIPVTAIEPFIEAFTRPGERVLDPFAGSGMTGVAAAITGREAILRDINVLGRHIGTNYVNFVDPTQFAIASDRAVHSALAMLGDVYGVVCEQCGQRAKLSRRTWSYVIQCHICQTNLNYYHQLKAANWLKKRMVCPGCNGPVATRGALRTNEEPVLDTIVCSCSPKLLDQTLSDAITEPNARDFTWPDVPIGSDRQMFQASALAKHGLVTTSKFFSERNLCALTALRDAIYAESDVQIRQKMLFAFTAIVARASKRYQWSRKRPLNAAHQHYYIAPVFYEWNIFDLFMRKVSSVLRSDAFVRKEMQLNSLMYSDETFTNEPHVEYEIGSATALNVPDSSIDYVFTDPPFGSNIFYSDMTLFQEAWLGQTTDHSSEAVVDRSKNGTAVRSAERYECLLSQALRECYRVLKPERWLSLVFSNSNGKMWALIQRAIIDSGFALDMDHIAILNKGQRSIKGLTSGYEKVVTEDLVLSMKKTGFSLPRPSHPPLRFLESSIRSAIALEDHRDLTRIYLNVVKQHISRNYLVDSVHLHRVHDELRAFGQNAGHSHSRAR